MSETALPSTDVALSNKVYDLRQAFYGKRFACSKHAEGAVPNGLPMQNVPLISEEDYQAMKAVDTDDCIVLLDVRSATDFRERYARIRQI